MDGPGPGAATRGRGEEAALSDGEEEEPECRICRCTAEEMDEILFSPCQCKGSLKWVHPSCLEQWRQACPTAASRVRCDMCRTEFNLQQQAPKCADVCGPVGNHMIEMLLGIVLFESAALGCGLLVNGIAALCSQESAHFTPDFELHLNGWTLMLPQGATAAVLRRARRSHLQMNENNPAYQGPWLARLLFERCGSVASHVLVFVGVLVLILVPMGYLGKLVVWIGAGGQSTFDATDAAGGDVDEGEETYVRHIAWGLDTAHFYIASLVFCISAFFTYLVAISCAFARQNPDRMRCAKALLTVLLFEAVVIAGGFAVKLLAWMTGVYDEPVECYSTADCMEGDPTTTEESNRGSTY